MPRRVATGVDPKRLAMVIAVLSRHAGIALGSADVFVNVAGGVRIDEPGADLAVALAIASAARGVPVREGAAAFGEIGLTGRLRQAAQAERRLEECGKLGIAAVAQAPALRRVRTAARGRRACSVQRRCGRRSRQASRRALPPPRSFGRPASARDGGGSVPTRRFAAPPRTCPRQQIAWSAPRISARI